MWVTKDENFYPALVNLADLYRLQNRDQEGEATLRKILALDPKDVHVLHALGLLLVRTGKKDDALGMFEQMVNFLLENSCHGYVCAAALSSTRKKNQALRVLKYIPQCHPNVPRLLFMLEPLHGDEVNRMMALQGVEKLLPRCP